MSANIVKIQITDPKDRLKLARFHDKRINESIQSWVVIEENELWRELGFDSFEAYMREKGKSYASIWQLREAVKIQRELPDIKIESTAAALALRKVKLPNRREVAQEAEKIGEGKVTAPAVQKAVKAYTPPPKLDAQGIEVPPEIMDFWNRNTELKLILGQIQGILRTVKQANDDNDRLFRKVDLQGCISKLKQLHEEFSAGLSEYVCPDCNGYDFEGCKTCAGRGTLSSFWWKFIDDRKKLKK